MAVSRGGVALCVGCVRSHGRSQLISTRSGGHVISIRSGGHVISTRSGGQAAGCPWICKSRPLSSASWALSPPNSLRYQSQKQPQLSQPTPHWEDWGESFSVCVVVQRGESLGLATLLELPLPTSRRLGDSPPPLCTSDLCFPLTTVDGRREDDISVGSLRRHGAGAAHRQHGCFRSLLHLETCPAPYTTGSHFYCFHCPGTPLGTPPGMKLGTPPGTLLGTAPGPSLGTPPGTLPGTGGNFVQDVELCEPAEPPASLCSAADGAEGAELTAGDGENQEQLNLMYERLRMELPGFFQRRHDFSLYSTDLDFINGLLHTRTRGRGMYQLTISLWRFLCMCYYADAHLEVLKMTKHLEDGTIRARWRVRGLPLYALLLRFYRRDKSHLYRSFDAFSTFYVGQDGLIHCHKVEKVMPAPPPALPRLPSLLAGVLVALGVQDHRPALNLLPLLLSSLRQSRN